jgi:hypothetical protein
MSHHYSGPDFTFPHGDARVDLCDLFAFPKPENTSKSIFIMDVHPSVGANPPEPTPAEPFAPEAIYELKIDTDRDALADIAFRVLFSPSENRAQSATVRRVEGADAAGMGDGGEAIIEGAPVTTEREAQVTEAGDYRFFAGWRSDPFFFDAGGAANDFQFTGDDFFADKDVCSIALEVPNRDLALWDPSFRTNRRRCNLRNGLCSSRGVDQVRNLRSRLMLDPKRSDRRSRASRSRRSVSGSSPPLL